MPCGKLSVEEQVALTGELTGIFRRPVDLGYRADVLGHIDMSVLRWIVESGHRDWIRPGEALGVSIRP